MQFALPALAGGVTVTRCFPHLPAAGVIVTLVLLAALLGGYAARGLVACGCWGVQLFCATAVTGAIAGLLLASAVPVYDAGGRRFDELAIFAIIGAGAFLVLWIAFVPITAAYWRQRVVRPGSVADALLARRRWRAIFALSPPVSMGLTWLASVTLNRHQYLSLLESTRWQVALSAAGALVLLALDVRDRRRIGRAVATGGALIRYPNDGPLAEPPPGTPPMIDIGVGDERFVELVPAGDDPYRRPPRALLRIAGHPDRINRLLPGSLRRGAAVVLSTGGLAAIVIHCTPPRGDRGWARKEAWQEVSTVTQAITTYQVEHGGDCPPDLDALVRGKFLSYERNDPWGNPYRFACPGNHLPEGADVWSVGWNEEDEGGGGDDVPGWMTWGSF